MILFLLFLLLAVPAWAVDIQVDAASGRKPISSAIYGRNNSLSDDPGDPLSAQDWQFLRDAGVRLLRENGGNNCTKYNWRRHLSSHPDWYNNVYSHDWDFAAQSLDENLPGVMGIWSFQLLGKVAKTNQYNFNDWEYNGSEWWEGVSNNWAGGGGPTTGDGNPDLYLMDWPPDSTVAILDHWFEEIGLDPESFQYWNMDNEPECWGSTHDDAMPNLISAEAYMQIYFEVAKKAREKFPDIKLCGPVFTNEWQWYNWDDAKIRSGGKGYTWVEYFIKRIGEEQAASGVRLLDVLDFHFYPYETEAEDIVQLHRVWFDKTYVYPGANGVKRSGSGDWDDSIRKEYIFERSRQWLDQYLGPNHDVGLGVSEMGIQSEDPNVTAVWYASTLGVFADEGVELFTPWTWREGMWEVLHLFSRYHQPIRISSVSNEENAVSAYSALSEDGKSLSIILVNRDLNSVHDAHVSLSHYEVSDGEYQVLMLHDLSNEETFLSHTQNALKRTTVTVQNGAFSLSLPALSITSVLLSGNPTQTSVASESQPTEFTMGVYPNPFNPATKVAFDLPESGKVDLVVYDASGRHIQTIQTGNLSAGSHEYSLDGSRWASGVYVIRLIAGSLQAEQKILLIK